MKVNCDDATKYRKSNRAYFKAAKQDFASSGERRNDHANETEIQTQM